MWLTSHLIPAAGDSRRYNPPSMSDIPSNQRNQQVGQPSRRLSVAMLPELVDDALLPTSTVVIIDVFRASTTIIHALANGATAVHPCVSVEDAQKLAERFPPDQRLLGGERGGVKIPGFELGNSPFEYTPEIVRDKEVIFTTTNGTRALNRCLAARRIVIGAFVNISAVARSLQSSNDDVLLVCAGTAGRLTAEDILFAGSLVESLTEPADQPFATDLGAELARDFTRQRSKSNDAWQSAMQASRGGANLMALGYERDIERSITRDVFEVVPVWDRESGVLVAAIGCV